MWPALDWNAVAAARCLGSQRALSLGLTVARELLGAPVNKAIAERVEPAQIKALIDYICHRLCADAHGSRARSGSRRRCVDVVAT